MIVSELKEIKSVKLGDVDIQKVYSGDDKVFGKEEVNEWFYVYHSSTGLIERFPVTNSFNIVEKVTSDHYYGGYSSYSLYSNLYSVAGDYTKAIIDNTLSVDFVDNKLQDINWHGYDGSAVSFKDKDNKTVSLLLAKSYYETVNGTNFSPRKNEVYYLLEVIKNYIDLYLCLVSDSIENNVYNGFGVTGLIDGNRYESVITTINDTVNKSISASLTIDYGVNGVNKSYKFKPTDISLRGYVAPIFTHSFGLTTGNIESPLLDSNKDYPASYEVTTYDNVVSVSKNYIFNKHDCSVDNPPTLIEQN